jgi:hypothetical protein
MHTSTTLRSEHFEISVDGRPGTIETLFPGFDERDRLGIVIDCDWGAAGAGTVILAAVTGFYDRLRTGGRPFIAYPDYFAFHVGRARGSLSELDVFPAHKEVVVTAEPEQIARAVNDRGVTRLLVPDGASIAGDGLSPSMDGDGLEPFTRASAERRIRTALAYSPTGRTPAADVRVAGSATTESLVKAIREPGTANLPPGPSDGGRPVESLRRLTVTEALALIAAQPAA